MDLDQSLEYPRVYKVLNFTTRAGGETQERFLIGFFSRGEEVKREEREEKQNRKKRKIGKRKHRRRREKEKGGKKYKRGENKRYL